MGDLKYEKSDREWAREKGLILHCDKHNIDYDPKIGCTKCLEEQREDKERKLKEAFNRVIWPD